MRVSVQGFWASKSGNDESEYEDDFCPRPRMISKKDRIFRFAVADGATETSFSGIWAKQLVRAFCKGWLDGPEFSEHMRSLRQQWNKVVSRKPLPWYGEEKIRSGAFAAIAGLVLEETDSLTGQGNWKAMALGDSCIFHLRRTKVLECFPVQKSEDFNNSPRLLASKAIVGEAELPELPAVSGVWLAGDTFYLMTDAIACWFLTQAESSKTPARELQDLTDGIGNPFKSWLTTLREKGHLRNDDITILRVEIENI